MPKNRDVQQALSKLQRAFDEAMEDMCEAMTEAREAIALLALAQEADDE